MTKLKELYDSVTRQIITDLECGERTWAKPWTVSGSISRPLRHTGEPYNGINILMLWASALEQGFSRAYWFTYRQAKELGAQVRKGQKGSCIIYARNAVPADDQDEESSARAIPVIRAYTVFNADQIDGLPDRYREDQDVAPLPDSAILNFFDNTGANIIHGGHRACYRCISDEISMPFPGAFNNTESYIAVLAHELIHWTGHPTRLDRNLSHLRFGEEQYAREELVAELGAAFLCADLGNTLPVREDHAPYIASWLKLLRDDHKAVFTAAAHVQRAVDYLHGLQPYLKD